MTIKLILDYSKYTYYYCRELILMCFSNTTNTTTTTTSVSVPVFWSRWDRWNIRTLQPP